MSWTKAGIGALMIAVFVTLLARPSGMTTAAVGDVRDPSIHAGSLGFEIHDVDTGALIPGKVTVLGSHGTATPQWTRGDLPREESGFIMAYNRVFSLTGVGAVPLSRGTYDVYVSRGLEWELFVVRGIQIAKGRRTNLSAKIRHVVETPGWLSADFHVHAAMSPIRASP